MGDAMVKEVLAGISKPITDCSKYVCNNAEFDSECLGCCKTHVATHEVEIDESDKDGDG